MLRLGKTHVKKIMKNVPEYLIPLRKRLQAIIRQETDEVGRFGWLQKQTGIPRNTWQTWWDKEETVPSSKMIETTARLWPKYAFWLASGLTDEEYGHTYPKSVGRKAAWPEYEGVEMKRGSDYFTHCAKMQMRQLGQDKVYENKKLWEDDWAMLDALSWFREVERESFKTIPHDERIKKKPAKVSPWLPDEGDGIHLVS
jgi:hypothetical protein